MALLGPAFANSKKNPLYIEIPNTKLFYTSGDRIEGIVRVEPSLRPKQIGILFRGFSIIYDTDATGIKPEFFRESQDLFISTGVGENFDILRRGTAEDGKVELPFSLTFPCDVTLAPPANRTWWYSKDSYNHPRFQHTPGFRLPPSCTPITSVNGPKTPKIIYHLEARMESSLPDGPRLNVRQELMFSPPAPAYHEALLQPDLNFGVQLPKQCARYKLIRTRKLLPGYGTSSKLSKIKDVLVEKELFFGLASYAEVPYVKFNLFATPARVVVLGSRIPIILTVQHLDRSKSLPNPPDLFLRRARVQLHSTFNTFVPSPAGAKHAREIVDTAKETITLFERRFDLGHGEPLYNLLNLLEIGDVSLVHDRVLPSFTSYGLTLEHELQVEIWGECAGNEFAGIACKEQVQLVTGWYASPPVGLDDDDSRPEYQELDPLASIHELETSLARFHELPTGGSVQELDLQTPSYDSVVGPPPVQTERPRVVPPPPYVG